MTVDEALPAARRIWAAVEPLAANVYFAPEAHRAYQALGFAGPSRVSRGIEYPDMVAYFTSRGACLGPQVPGDVVAAAFGVFKRSLVVDAVARGWQQTDHEAILTARQQGAVASLRRILGDEPDRISWATDVLRRMADAAPAEGRHLHAGLRSLGYPGDPVGDLWRAADLVREHRGDCHIAAWISADLDATEVGLLTDLWRGLPIKSWVRSRGWTDDDLDAACDRLRHRGLLAGDQLTDGGWQLRQSIEDDTDRMVRRVVDALGDDDEALFALLGGWNQRILAAGGYPTPVVWPRR